MKISTFIQLLMFVNCAVHEIHMYRHKFKRARLEARKQKLQNKNVKSMLISGFASQQIHIAFGKKPTEIVVMWATNADEPKMEVQYRFNTKEFDMVSVVGDQVELDTNNDKGTKYWHRAYLKNLKPGLEYFYRITSKQYDATSEMFSFQVPPLKTNHVHSYMVLADMGTMTKNLQFVVQEAVNRKYTSVFHIGDIAYNLHEGKGSIGDIFLNKIQPMAARIPYFVAPGDHEAKFDFKHYRYRFSMPHSNWPMKTDKLYYSFTLGAAHFISLNIEMFFSNSKKKDVQVEWLKKDLETVNKKTEGRPWIIVMGHRPLYSSCDGHNHCLTQSTEAPLLKKQLEDLFFKFGVDLYFCGHNHNYERTWPVYKNIVKAKNYKNPKAPIYITIGSLGSAILTESIDEAGGLWSAKRISNGDEHYGVLDVLNTTHLIWKVFKADNNEKADNIWVIQQSKNRLRNAKSYLEKGVRNQTPELPPEPLMIVGRPDYKYINIKTHGVVFKDSGLIVALITVCSFVFLLCIFYKRLWKR